MLWELPMSTEAEYDGVSVITGNTLSLESIPPEADRILLYHLASKGEITGGAFRHSSLEGRAAMFDLEHKDAGAMVWAVP